MHSTIASFGPNTASSERPAVKSTTASKVTESKACIPASMFVAARRAVKAMRVAVLALLVSMALPLTAHAADTQPPAVPTGLRGAALSTSAISLSWNATTDNVGVKGY